MSEMLEIPLAPTADDVRARVRKGYLSERAWWRRRWPSRRATLLEVESMHNHHGVVAAGVLIANLTNVVARITSLVEEGPPPRLDALAQAQAAQEGVKRSRSIAMERYGPEGDVLTVEHHESLVAEVRELRLALDRLAYAVELIAKGSPRRGERT